MDEHRIGLKPIVRGVWAPVGERPIAFGHHRFEWLYVTGFVEPATGRTVWNIANAVCKELFELILADFDKSAGASAKKRIVLRACLVVRRRESGADGRSLLRQSDLIA